MHMEVRNEIAEQLIVDVTRLEHPFYGAPDLLDIQPIVGKFVRRKIGEGCHMSAPKDHRRVALRDGMAFEKRFADSAAVKRSAGQVGTEWTSDPLLALLPVLRPGSCHATVPPLCTNPKLIGTEPMPRRRRLAS